ncbi:MAG: LbtU family siderophore porin [Desulfurivibrionaceae bacterium]
MKIDRRITKLPILKEVFQHVVAFMPLIMPALMLFFVPAVSHAGERDFAAEIDRIRSRLSIIEAGSGSAVAPAGPTWAERLTFSGVVEVEAGFSDGDDGSESDIAVATVEFGLEAQINGYSAAQVLFLYEDGEDLGVDEAFITLGNLERNPLYLTAGKLYVPFGNYETQMISDPLTLEIGEGGENVIQIGIETAGFYASAYGFNGDTADGGSDVVEHYGLNGGYALESAAFSLDIGGGWLSSIGDTDGLSDALGGGPVAVNDYIDGYAAHLITGYGPFTLIGEYVGAGDDLDGADSQISAYNLEAGIFFPLAGREASIALGYQKTEEARWADLPEKRMVSALAVEIMDSTSLALEWMNEEDYDGIDSDVYTLQLGVEF